MTKKHLLICTPCYGGNITHQTFISVIKFMLELQRQNYPFNISFSIRAGDSLIPRIRNSMAAEFLAQDKFTHMLFIDADIGFEPDMIFKLVNSGHELATGVYPLKNYAFPEKIKTNGADELTMDDIIGKYMRYPLNPISTKFDIVNCFVEVKDAPTGMMLIQRSVFEKLIAAYPELKYEPDHTLGLEKIDQKIKDYYYAFFDTGIVEDQIPDPRSETGFTTKKRYLSEDYMFCRFWQQIGGKAYAYANSRLTHTGVHTFSGDLGKFFKLNFSVTEKKPETAPIVNPTSVPQIIPSGDVSSLLKGFSKPDEK